MTELIRKQETSCPGLLDNYKGNNLTIYNINSCLRLTIKTLTYVRSMTK